VTNVDGHGSPTPAASSVEPRLSVLPDTAHLSSRQFDHCGDLDLASQRRHTHKGGIRDLAAHDVDRIFAAGMTGEFTTLTDEERLDVCEAPAQARTATRPFWQVGAGWQYQGTRLAEGAVGRGAAKLAVLTPYCFAAIGSAILSYYDAVLARAVGLPFAPTCSLCVPQPQPPPSSWYGSPRSASPG